MVSYEDGELSVLDGDGKLLWKLGSVRGDRYQSEYQQNQWWSLAWMQDGRGVALACWQRNRRGYLYLFKEGADNHETLQSTGPTPGTWSRRLQQIRCLVGIHYGKWEYRTRSACGQVLVCPDHGPTKSRMHHSLTSVAFDPGLDKIDGVFYLGDRGGEHVGTFYRCRRCN